MQGAGFWGFAAAAVRFWFFALQLCVLALPLCHGMACRSCRDGQLLLEEQK